MVAVAFIGANAQTLFQQDFENGMDPMTLVDNDGRTPAPNVAAYALAWNIANPAFGNGSNVAISNSWYAPAGAADDWMITPSIAIPATGGVVLQWEAKAQDASFPDGYQVRISTTGTALADFTNVAFNIGAEMTDWQTRSVDLAAYAGQNIHIAFRNNSNDMFLLLVDNIFVGAILNHDISIEKLNIDRYNLTGGAVNISGEIKNLGYEPITTFTLTWSDGTNSYPQTVTLSSPLALGQTTTFSHSTPLQITDTKAYNIQVSATNPNGVADQDGANNSANATTFGLAYAPAKTMFVEEATGTWCPWCPRGTEWMDFMAENYPDDFIGIAVHNSDPMTVDAYDAGLGEFPDFPGYPSVIIDRVLVEDPDQLEEQMSNSLDRLVPADIPTATAVLDVATRKISIDANTKFATSIANHDFRFNVVLVEDGVTGTGAGYNQANNYAGAGAPTDPIPGFGLDWDAQPNPAPAAQMVYNHVARAILGGWAGTAGSIPATAALGENVSRSYPNVDFDASWNPKKTHAVVMILDNSTGEVVNAGEADEIEIVCPPSLGATATVTQPTNFINGEIDLTPPANTFGFGGYTFEWSNGETTADMDGLSPGTYSVTISDKFEACDQVLTVEVTSASSVEDIAALTSFSLTPNPAATVSVLNATFSQPVELNVNVISIDGKVVKSFNFENATVVNHSMDLSSFADGIYLVKMSVGAQVRTQRLVVAK